MMGFVGCVVGGGKRGRFGAELCRRSLKFEWRRVVPSIGEEAVSGILEARDRGDVVIPIASGHNERVMLPTETVNLLVPTDVAGMVLESEHRCLGTTMRGSSSGMLVHVEEDHWGFSDMVQLRCIASQRFRVERFLESGALRSASVQLFKDKITESINEELEMVVAMKQVSDVLKDMKKINTFLKERSPFLGDVSESLDDVLRYLKFVLAASHIAETTKDKLLTQEEIFSFALLRPLALDEQEKLTLFHYDSTIDRIQYVESELRKGLAAVKSFTVENYEDVPPQLLD